jgi:hypothetical protein
MAQEARQIKELAEAGRQLNGESRESSNGNNRYSEGVWA